MRNLIMATALLMVVLLSPVAEAASKIQSSGKFGVGVQAGYPLEGISMNWFLTENTSLQFGVALWLRNDWTAIGARVDYLWWMPKLKSWSWGDLGWYLGPGVDVFSWSWEGPGQGDGFVGLGAELPVGIGLQFAKVPVDLNLEAVPVLWVLGGDGIDLDLDIGSVLNARWYF